MRIKTLTELPEISAEHFISLGAACRPARWLKHAGLRKCSLPFDWLGLYSLSLVIDTLRSGCRIWFTDWYEDENRRTKTHRCILDRNIKLRTLHTFPISMEPVDYFPTFWSIFEKRTARFQNICKTAGHICFVFNRDDNIDTVAQFAKNICEMYPQLRLTLIQVIHSDTDRQILQYLVNRRITIYTITANDTHENGADMHKNPQFWLGNCALWESITSKLKIQSSPSMKNKLIYHDISELPEISAEHFISLGNTSKTAYWLQHFGLRITSMPFDWFRNANFDIVLDTLKNGCHVWFRDWYEDVEGHTPTNHKVVDKNTGMMSRHAFPLNVPVVDYFPTFWSIFEKRTARFQEICRTSRHICFVFDRDCTLDAITSFAHRMHRMYPWLRMTMIQVTHSDTENIITKHRVHRYLTVYMVRANDSTQMDAARTWIGNPNLWVKLMEKCRRIKYKYRYGIFPYVVPAVSETRRCPVRWRLDIKNLGAPTNSVTIDNIDANVSVPGWFTDDMGRGVVVSGNSLSQNITMRVSGNGNLRLTFCGPDCRVNGKRVPSWVDYSVIKVDGEKIIHEPTAAWHDRPYIYEMPVSDGQIVSLEFAQKPHVYENLDEHLSQMATAMQLDSDGVDKLRKYLSGEK